MINTIKLTVKTGGEPAGAEQIRWNAQEFGTRQRFPNGNVLQSWNGEVMAAELPTDRDATDTFAGAIVWRKFRHLDGQIFYFGYGKGEPRTPDYGVIEVLADE